MNNLEMEFKWDANFPRAFYKMKCAVSELSALGACEKVYNTDTYLDDEKETLSSEKIALRVRNSNAKWEVTFKTKTEIKNGLAVRREETLPLKNVSTLAQALSFLRRKKLLWGINVGALLPRFTIKNKRTVYPVRWQKMTAELALDDFTILVCGRAVKMKEIELELKKGDAAAFQIFAQNLAQKSGLKSVKNSKVKTAETLRKLWKV